MDGSEAPALASGNAGILTLGIDADAGEGIVDQVGNDGADPLAAARRRNRQQMGGARVAQQLAGLAVAADQQTGITHQIARLDIGGKAGRAMGVVSVCATITQDQGLEERA